MPQTGAFDIFLLRIDGFPKARKEVHQGSALDVASATAHLHQIPLAADRDRTALGQRLPVERQDLRFLAVGDVATNGFSSNRANQQNELISFYFPMNSFLVRACCPRYLSGAHNEQEHFLTLRLIRHIGREQVIAGDHIAAVRISGEDSFAREPLQPGRQCLAFQCLVQRVLGHASAHEIEQRPMRAEQVRVPVGTDADHRGSTAKCESIPKVASFSSKSPSVVQFSIPYKSP